MASAAAWEALRGSSDDMPKQGAIVRAFPGGGARCYLVNSRSRSIVFDVAEEKQNKKGIWKKPDELEL